MPLVERIRIQEGVIYGIWEIEEPAPYFEERLMLSPDEANQVMALKGRRQIEWLASRWLLHMISAREKRSDLVKDSYGKPHILGQGDFISISHTHGFTAAILADKPVGIDVQVRVEKIYRIANKFMNQEEITNVNPLRQLDFLHVYWGA
ncbi:MAG: hypothetical protein OEQ53_14605, partial [Saprospiraceae bacterium]|nr:hypothetical protein [Saprospiraceae bacterium]